MTRRNITMATALVIASLLLSRCGIFGCGASATNGAALGGCHVAPKAARSIGETIRPLGLIDRQHAAVHQVFGTSRNGASGNGETRRRGRPGAVSAGLASFALNRSGLYMQSGPQCRGPLNNVLPGHFVVELAVSSAAMRRSSSATRWSTWLASAAPSTRMNATRKIAG